MVAAPEIRRIIRILRYTRCFAVDGAIKSRLPSNHKGFCDTRRDIKVIEPSTPPSFGERLKHHRRLLDLTQAELARRAGCARVTIHKIESGDLRPSKQLAALLAQALQIPAADRKSFVELARGAQAAEERRARTTCT